MPICPKCSFKYAKYLKECNICAGAKLDTVEKCIEFMKPPTEKAEPVKKVKKEKVQGTLF